MDYERFLSRTVQELEPSGIRKFFDLLEGRKNVISLTVGQPDFLTPWHIRVAGIESLEAGNCFYTSNAGMPQLREEISAYLRRRFSLDYHPEDEILVTVGGSEAIDLAFRACLNPGDEVIVPQPAFVCYGPLARLAGGVPVYLETKPEDGFRLTAEGLLSAVTDKTKMLVLPFPNNPTGAVMSEEDLVRIAKVVAEKDLLVLSDEIYAELTYGKKHVSFASLPGMRDRTVVVSGLSKSYAMTGWRIGYTAAPKEITKQMTKVHQFGIMCASTTSQYAGIEALRNGDEDIRAMHDEYNRRRRFIVSGLEAIGFRCFNPEGAFYVFPKIPDLGMNSEEFCRCLFEEENVAIVPGTAFGKCGEGYARISYAYSVEHINRALDKMEQFLAHHA